MPAGQEPLVVPAEDIIPEEDQTCASAIGVIESPDGKFLRTILGMNKPLGRRTGQRGLPKEVQAAAAVTAELVDTRTAAKVFDMSTHHADELKHGFTNQEARYGGEDPDKDLAKVINKQKKAVRDLAFDKLTKTLGLIDDDKLMAVTDPLKLTRMAKDLSGVVDKVLPKEAASVGGIHFHVWRPEMRSESDFETVTVGAQR